MPFIRFIGGNLSANSFKKHERILKRTEYIRLKEKGKRVDNPLLFINYAKSEYSTSRLGITVTRRVGNAVYRNKFKRMIREYFRTHKNNLQNCWDINVIAKPAAREAGFFEIQQAMDTIFKEIDN